MQEILQGVSHVCPGSSSPKHPGSQCLNLEDGSGMIHFFRFKEGQSDVVKEITPDSRSRTMRKLQGQKGEAEACRTNKGQTQGDEAWPFAFGRKVAADKGSESAATGRMRVRGMMGD